MLVWEVLGQQQVKSNSPSKTVLEKVGLTVREIEVMINRRWCDNKSAAMAGLIEAGSRLR